ncbi:MAG: acyltransferase [Gluconobacter japonicus]|uniref:acyltransferase family protein n=1 Tax=Gluconobacter japonicus TaxID=376620 RepID=UPI000B058701|nr:acyltransferase [Gluconobacter japonicus]
MKRNAALDCMRGAAILLVLGNHLGIRIPLIHTALGDFLPHWFLVGMNYNGGEAVSIFFVLSGFLIASRVLQRFGALDQIQPLPFIAHRAARILPCLVALVTVLGLLDYIGFEDYRFVKPGQSFSGATLAAFGLYFNVWQARHGWSVAGWTVLWSLSIEELFYLFFPFFCHLNSRIRVGVLVALAIIAPIYRATLHGNEIWREQATLTGVGTIAMGVLMAIVAANYRPKGRWPVVMGVLGLGMMLAEMWGPMSLWHLLPNGLIVIFYAGIAMLVLACGWRSFEGGAGSWWVRRMGQLSYEVYLTHMFVVMAVVRIWKHNHWPQSMGWIVYPICLVLIWGLGEAVSRFFSRPVALLLDREVASRFRRRVLVQNPNM